MCVYLGSPGVVVKIRGKRREEPRSPALCVTCVSEARR